MNAYQLSVVRYFQEQQVNFLEWLPHSDPKDSVVVNDLVALGLGFLNEKLKEEMRLYHRTSDRHRILADMLIEVHVAKSPSPFHGRLKEIIEQLFLSNHC